MYFMEDSGSIFDTFSFTVSRVLFNLGFEKNYTFFIRKQASKAPKT